MSNNTASIRPKKENRDYTNSPKLWDYTWGISIYSDYNEQIIENRNNFEIEQNIKKSVNLSKKEYLNNMLDIKILYDESRINRLSPNKQEKINLYKKQHNLKKFRMDHIEVYKSNTHYIGIFSIYGDLDEEDKKYAENFGYNLFHTKLYSSGAATYIKKIPININSKNCHPIFKYLYK